MASFELNSVSRFEGAPRIPGDKSISHRALILGALARGTTRVRGLLDAADVRSTRKCLQSLGVEIRSGAQADEVFILGMGLGGWREPASQLLDCGNSGTSMRLLAGALSCRPFTSILTGDVSLCSRPMKRIADPLVQMGAVIRLTGTDHAPIHVGACPALRPVSYSLPIPSAQIKSALLLAALFADGETRLSGRIDSRDHTERLLPAFGVPVRKIQDEVVIRGGSHLSATEIEVPGDPSTAAFWIGAACLVRGGTVVLRRVSLNPTRTGFIEVLKKMGASIHVELKAQNPEPIGDLQAGFSNLSGISIGPDEIPGMIDEIPMLAVLASQAHGITEVRGAGELRAKECDRLEAIGAGLRAMGVSIHIFEDGFRIEGPQKLKGARIDTREDHRIAMAFSVAALVAEGKTEILNSECVGISYPDFFKTLSELTHA